MFVKPCRGNVGTVYIGEQRTPTENVSILEFYDCRAWCGMVPNVYFSYLLADNQISNSSVMQNENCDGQSQIYYSI